MNDNFLDSGAVLPFGLLGNGSEAQLAGFNRSYKNTALKAGIVIQSYATNDPKNITGLCTEYDVLVIEQNSDMGATSIIYKNCLSSQGLGSIADYFETTLRPNTVKKNKGSLTFKDQDGAIVLLLCLDGLGEKGIVISSLNHPDRKTNLTDISPKLAGEYNGVKLLVNPDGSCSLVFTGATDNQGVPTDASQGNTNVQIEKNGSFQVNHDSVTFRMDRDGAATLNAKKDINLVTNANLNVTATANVNVQCVDVNVNSTGKAEVKVTGDTEMTVGGNCDLTVTGTARVNAKQIQLNGIEGRVLTTATDPVFDYITGVPSIGSSTVFAGS